MQALIISLVITVAIVIVVGTATYLDHRKNRLKDEKARIQTLLTNADQWLVMADSIQPFVSNSSAPLFLIQLADEALQEALEFDPGNEHAKATLRNCDYEFERLQDFKDVKNEIWFRSDAEIAAAQKMLGMVIPIMKHCAEQQPLRRKSIAQIIDSVLWDQLIVRVNSLKNQGLELESSSHSKANSLYRKAAQVLRNSQIKHHTRAEIVAELSDLIKRTRARSS